MAANTFKAVRQPGIFRRPGRSFHPLALKALDDRPLRRLRDEPI
jgi:hypothetical protein